MNQTAQLAEPFVGKVLSQGSFCVDDGFMSDYHGGLQLPFPADGAIPSMIASDPDNSYFSEIAFPNHRGHLWMRQEYELLEPLKAGIAYAVGGEIREIYSKRDRQVVRYEVELRGPDGKVALRSQHHQSFLSDTQSTGEVSLRDPNRKPGARSFERPEGREFGGLSRSISLEMCGEFFHGNSTYHTDRAASAVLGFSDVVVGGRMTLAYAAYILEEEFGAQWSTSGRLDLKFTNPLWAAETVTAHGVVTGPVPEEPERTGAFVWLTKPDDTVVLVAWASVLT